MVRSLAAAAALLAGLPLFQSVRAQSIALAEEDATVWAQEQVVRGTLSGASSGTLRVDGAAVPFTAEAGAFAVPLRLTAPVTTVVACASSAGGGEVCGDTLRWALGFSPRPEAELRAAVAGHTVTFAGHVIDNPSGGALSFAWAEAPGNPAPLGLAVATDSTASATVPDTAPPGEYTVAWTVRAADGGERTARTFVTVRPDGTVAPFVIETDHAGWIDRAIVYEVTPRHFPGSYRGSFDAVRRKLPELASLGVNTLWLQPVYPTTDEDQGYSVTDFFGVRSDLGTPADLHTLVDAAHDLGMRVLFDFVPNHSAIQHPYARDAIAHGARSHYAAFYQQTRDTAPYSEAEQTRTVGQMTFVYYFYDQLVNFDYDNPEVQRFITEATRFWVEAYGIDGFRFDAVWGVQARNPAFTQAWRVALKRVRPDLFLLAEAKATDEALFDARFDAAYDWSANESYISQWAWQRASQAQTIFNTGLERFRARDLRNALTDYGRGYAPGAVVFRYLENNDTPRFARSHSVAQTKMAATLLFALPGIPMLYYGQEAGFAGDLYQTPPFATTRTIRSYSEDGLFETYQHLARVRAAFPAFTEGDVSDVPVSPASAAGQTYAFRRRAGTGNVVAVANLGSADVVATLALPASEMGFDPAATVYLTDLATGEALATTGAALGATVVDVPATTTRLFAVATEVVAIPTADEPAAAQAPGPLVLEAPFPNPFSNRATLAFSLAAPGHAVLRVFDVLGREVARPVDADAAAGRHEAPFDGSALASGVYLLRLESGGQAATRRLVVAR